MGRHIYISTGEISGEQHAAQLVQALHKKDPEIHFSGMGGSRLRSAGVDTVVDLSEFAVVGFLEVIRHLPSYSKAFRETMKYLKANRPDVVILVDYAGFHLRLAAAAKRKFPDLKIIYYIAPKVWAWQEKRVEKIRQFVDQVLCLFPFEEKYFAGHEINAKYVGNPVVDAVRDQDGTALRSELGITAEQKLIALFPGSRRKEIERLLPPMLDGLAKSREAHPDIAAALSAAPGFLRDDLNSVTPLPDNLPVVEERNLELLAASDILLAKSGTTTLEAALLGKPMVVVYKSNWLSMMIAKKLVKIPHFSLPNIVAQREIVTELLQAEVTGDALCREIDRLLTDDAHYATIQRDLTALRATFGDQPASATAATAVIDFLDNV